MRNKARTRPFSPGIFRWFLAILCHVLVSRAWATPVSISDWKQDGIFVSLFFHPEALAQSKKIRTSPFFLTPRTTSEAALLLRAIDNFPDEDTPRLAYADYLDENGEADAAEFIRVQCEIATLPRPRDFRTKLNRAIELLENNEGRWLAPLHTGMEKAHAPWLFRRSKTTDDAHALILTFRRGFIWGGSISVSGPSPASNAENRRLYETAHAELFNQLHKLVPKVQGLQVPFVPPGALFVQALTLQHPIADQVSALYTGAHLVSVYNSEPFRKMLREKLIDLSLYFDSEELFHHDFMTRVGRRLGTHPELRKLARLNLIAEGERDDLEGTLHGPALMAQLLLGKWPELQELSATYLGIDRFVPGPEGGFPKLRALNLASNRMDDASVIDLSQLVVPSLVQLDLSANPFGSIGEAALVHLVRSHGLHYLDINKEPAVPPGGTLANRVYSGPARSGAACNILLERVSVFHP